MNVLLAVRARPEGDHPERSEPQLRKAGQPWGGSRARNRGSTDINPAVARVKEDAPTQGDLALRLKGRRRESGGTRRSHALCAITRATAGGRYRYSSSSRRRAKGSKSSLSRFCSINSGGVCLITRHGPAGGASDRHASGWVKEGMLPPGRHPPPPSPTLTNGSPSPPSHPPEAVEADSDHVPRAASPGSARARRR